MLIRVQNVALEARGEGFCFAVESILNFYFARGELFVRSLVLFEKRLRQGVQKNRRQRNSRHEKKKGEKKRKRERRKKSIKGSIWRKHTQQPTASSSHSTLGDRRSQTRELWRERKYNISIAFAVFFFDSRRTFIGYFWIIKCFIKKSYVSLGLVR